MTPARRTARLVLVAAALMLPTLSLVPLGGLYLWEKGYLITWALCALAMAVVTYALQRWMLADPLASAAAAAPQIEREKRPEDASPAERRAWGAVRQVATNVDLDKLESMESVLDLGQKTVEAAAKALHPEKPDHVWQFTVPEALAITERVSRRLGIFTVQNVPFGDRLTIAQLLRAYRWRGAIDVAEKAYDVWRVLRIANPVTAATHEARERLSKAMLNWGKEHVSRAFVEAYVEEVGRAAIDLYGGRLRVAHGFSTADQQGAASDATQRIAEAGGRMSVLIAGGSDGQRMAVAKAIQGAQLDTARAMLKRMRHGQAVGDPGFAVELLPSKSVSADAVDSKALIEDAASADVVALLIDDGAPIRDAVFAGLTALSKDIEAKPDRMPPVLLPLRIQAKAGSSQASAKGPADKSSAAAAEADHDLAGLKTAYDGPVAAAVTIPIEADEHAARADTLWRSLSAIRAPAQQVRAVRQIDLITAAPGWMESGRQVAASVMGLARTLTRRNKGDGPA